MANNIIRGQFWRDSYIVNSSANVKLVYLYLLTNSNIIGIYELPLKIIAFETGLNLEEVEQVISTLINDGKIAYSTDTYEICIINWVKNNLTYSLNINQLNGVKNYIKSIKNKELLKYIKTDNEKLNNIIKEYIPTQEQEQKQEVVTTSNTPTLATPTINNEKKDDTPKREIPQNIIELSKKIKIHQNNIKNGLIKADEVVGKNIDDIVENNNNDNDILRHKTDSEYQRLYDAYPKKRNYDAGYFEYLNLNSNKELPPIDELLLNLEECKKSNQWKNDQFIPHINNWLKGKKFLIKKAVANC